MTNSILALNALNFFLADVRDGLGPFIGVFLQQRHWPAGEIGFVMTIGGLAGMVATVPIGAMLDSVTAKRAVIVAAALLTVAATLVIFFQSSFWLVSVSKILTGVAGAAIGPAIAAITLGLVKQKGFPHQLGRNEAFNHGGNVVAALLAGGLGYLFGFGAVFSVMSAMAVFSIVSVLLIDPKEIDHRAARGLSEKKSEKSSSFAVLVESLPLLVLGLTLTLFHLGNAAMLPLLGQSMVAAGAGDPSAYTGATIVIAQLSMIPMALFASWLAERRGYWVVFLLALIALPIRGAIASFIMGPIGLVPVQVLDGVGAGLLGVAVPGLVARILAGTGHINAGLGAVMTLQGVGASLSTTLGGVVAQHLGYAAAFLALGGVAFLALLLWLAARPLMAAPCRASPA